MTLFSSLRAGPTVATLLFLSACVGAPTSAPPPASHHPRPAPAAPLPKDWRDWPVAKGGWTYWTISGSSIAAFGEAGRPAQLVFRCELAGHRLFIARAIAPRTAPINRQLTVHTSFGDLQWPIVDTPLLAHGQPGLSATYAVSIRAASDRGLDQIAFSRGRFAIEAPDAAPLSVPGWAEVSRVIEDCRG